MYSSSLNTDPRQESNEKSNNIFFPFFRDANCDDCKTFIKTISTAMQNSTGLHGNATAFFNGTDFCGAKTPPANLSTADCQGFNSWFTAKAFNILGQVVGMTDSLLCKDVFNNCS